MTKGARVQSNTSGEYGTVIKTKEPVWNGEEFETELLITWDLDEDGDEPGWRWDTEIVAA